MLNIYISGGTLFDEKRYEFVDVQSINLALEHSLISISKWESKWHVPFIGHKLSGEELIDYVRCMCMNKKVDDNAFLFLNTEHLKRVQEYIDNAMSATTITDNSQNKSRNRQILTSEYIYYLMFANQIPIECEKWHLNRLIMLLRIFGIKNEPYKKMSKKEILAQNRRLNEARKAKLNTKG